MLIEGPPRIVVDPWRWRDDRAEAAYAVLVTDGHIDHCSPEDVAAAARGNVILAPAVVAPRLGEALGTAVLPMRPGMSMMVMAAAAGRESLVRALAGAAPQRAASFRPAGTAVTYLVESAGARLLLLGASDALPEHEGLSPDVAFFAVGGFTMPTPEEAADAAARVRPRLAVPTHWGDLSARYSAAQRFVALCRQRGIEAAAVGPGQTHRV